MPLRVLFETPTVEALAAWIAGRAGDAAHTDEPPLTPRPDDGRPLPLSFAQERLWFLDRLESTGSAYHVAHGLRLRGRLDRHALQAALDGLVARHESLRTRFPLNGSDPVQHVDPPAPVDLPDHDLDGLDPEDAERRLADLARDAVAAPFDLAAGPLLRARLVRLGPEHHVLILVLHHIVCDGWSLAVLVRDAAALYDAAAQGSEPDLPNLAVQYPDFALWQRRTLDRHALDAQLDWWRNALRNAPEALDLPTDRPRPARPSFRGDAVPLSL